MLQSRFWEAFTLGLTSGLDSVQEALKHRALPGRRREPRAEANRSHCEIDVGGSLVYGGSVQVLLYGSWASISLQSLASSPTASNVRDPPRTGFIKEVPCLSESKVLFYRPACPKTGIPLWKNRVHV